MKYLSAFEFQRNFHLQPRQDHYYAFENYKEYPALNSTFQHPFNKNEEKQLKEIKQLVKEWDGKGKNLILVTHYSIILAITGSAPSSGGIVITDKNFNVISTIDTN